MFTFGESQTNHDFLFLKFCRRSMTGFQVAKKELRKRLDRSNAAHHRWIELVATERRYGIYLQLFLLPPLSMIIPNLQWNACDLIGKVDLQVALNVNVIIIPSSEHASHPRFKHISVV